ncbi:unnamed protein product [Mytilus edulis]|uniref:Immunoglobulin V-set domain-containing protein n=1 Tax=Mytilus edulis TaxID=6550 RepID=A0A8S3VNQ9_MYTED|nr:unnamed protein product [Mytilus edulis]
MDSARQKYRKSFTTVYTDGWRVNTHLQFSERLKIVDKKGRKDYGLQISNVTMMDSGLYRCAVDTRSNLTYYFVTLEVKGNIGELQQSEHFYDKVDYDEMTCAVQNNSHITKSYYHYPDTRNIETMLVNLDNPPPGTSQKIDRINQASVSEHTYDYSYVSNVYQPLTENWGTYSETRTYAQCPPCQTVSGYYNIAD